MSTRTTPCGVPLPTGVSLVKNVNGKGRVGAPTLIAHAQRGGLAIGRRFPLHAHRSMQAAVSAAARWRAGAVRRLEEAA